MRAVIFMNPDDCICGRCGVIADDRDARHLNTFLVAGPTGGCGAEFYAASSEFELTPRLIEAISFYRPDLEIVDNACLCGHIERDHQGDACEECPDCTGYRPRVLRPRHFPDLLPPAWAESPDLGPRH